MSKPSLPKLPRPFQAAKIPPPRLHTAPSPWPSPVAIEIGAGAGLHAVQYGKAHPERTLFAIEHTSERFSKLQQRIEKNALPNVVPIHANAIGWITHFVPANSVDHLLLLYPNPYPKPKHLNRRWYADPFFSKMLEVLKPNGQLILATNLEDYAIGAKEWIQTVWKMKLDRALTLSTTTHPEHRAWTHFEKKYLARGQTVFHLHFTKSSVFNPSQELHHK